MSNQRENANTAPSYSALTEGELLALTTEQVSLTEAAKEAIAAELRQRSLGEHDVAAYRRDVERARSRRARWRRKQRMHLRELLSVLVVWPGMLFIPFALAVALVFILDPLLLNVLRLSQQQADLCEEIAAISVVLLCTVAMTVLILSERADALLRRWVPDGDRTPRSEEEKLRAHQRICPARNFGYALLLLLYSLYVLFLSVRDVEGWRILQEQPPPVDWPSVNTAGSILLIVFCSYFVIKAPCVREKLWLAFAATNFVTDLPKHHLRILSARELSLSNNISMGLWAAASIIALSIVKSAWQGPESLSLDRQP